MYLPTRRTVLSHTATSSRRRTKLAPQRAYLSSTNTAQDSQLHLPFSMSSLGLDRTFVAPVLASIQQLPEVETALTQFPSASQEPLQRAADVFASFQKGGSEHLATLALLAESQQRQAQYAKVVDTLDTLYELFESSNRNTPNGREDMILAQAKALWYQGDFASSQELCESIIQGYDDLQETFPTTNLHLASAMTGKALSQLASMKTIEDAYSVRDYFKITKKFLERHPPSDNSLPVVAAHLNAGIAEAVYNGFLEEMNNVSVPMDAALKSWFQGNQRIETSSSVPPHLLPASKTLEANLKANMAWGILHYEQDRSDRLSKSSEYAGDALKVYDDTDAGRSAECLRRVLTVVASCYIEAHSAVTAEGLLQSASDIKTKQVVGPLQQLELEETYKVYSKLCNQWDKRQGDAEKYDRKAQEVVDSLPDGWKGKSGIFSGLWFWTPSDFL